MAGFEPALQRVLPLPFGGTRSLLLAACLAAALHPSRVHVRGLFICVGEA